MKQVLGAPLDAPGLDPVTRQNLSVLRETREAVNQNAQELSDAQAAILALVLRVNPDQMRWVAMSGAQYSSIAAACESITDASYWKRYTILVAPGVYGGFEIPDFVSVIGLSRHDCIICNDDPYGAVRMGNETLLENFLILSATNPDAWGIVSWNKTGVQVRHVDILGEMLAPPVRAAQGIRVVGDSWQTFFASDCIVNYLGTTGWGISIEGNATTPQLCDAHLENCFVDAFYATTGGCVRLKDEWGMRIRGGLYRTTGTGYALKLEATGAPPGNPVDAMLEGGAKVEAPGFVNTNLVSVGSYCSLYRGPAVCDYIDQPGTQSFVVDQQAQQWRVMPPIADWTWVNQGDTVCYPRAHGGWNMLQPKTRASITAPSLGMLVRETPTPPYELVARIIPCQSTKDFIRCGLVWRESGTGEVVAAEFSGTVGGVRYLAVTKFDSPTVFNSYYFSQPFDVGGPIWVKARDNGTLRQVFVSPDGIDWQGIHEVSRVDFLTANQVGIFVDAENDTTPNLDAQMLVEHLTLTSG